MQEIIDEELGKADSESEHDNQMRSQISLRDEGRKPSNKSLDPKHLKLHAKHEEEDEKKTVKIVMGTGSNKDLALPRESSSALLKVSLPSSSTKGKLNLGSTKKQPNHIKMFQKDSSPREARFDDYTQKEQPHVSVSLQQYENLSMDKSKVKTSENTPVSNYFDGNTLIPRDRAAFETKQMIIGSNNLEPEKTKEKKDSGIDDQIFYERETKYSFIGFMTSKEIHFLKKIGILYFLFMFILSAIFSIISLVQYSESTQRLHLGISILYYGYFGIAMLLRFSFYIFIQLEFQGKIFYSLKVG